MLFITVITFIGLPATNTYLSIVNDFNNNKFALDLTEEEEREGSKNESKEFENKLVNKNNSSAIFQYNLLNSIAFHVHLSHYSSLIKEVTTPPPEQLIT